ncbi:glycerol-3-phosphate dehydrogenase/oxidase [Saccharopolyspora sp. HNM0983]|uniref:Glycerol-3-phosphate dehydrogenase n=1 Tax=Saccharopolyspora montiporae TaxID=2781240 RepID=A0A929B5V1_9PSEU|nr:glycerol-3-phosphate dehydrogenase/oxidase [Saccharopolyspora sp. HNM0983]MBE9373769.1 glycerol-3-phosphate dehydrogenase/oxidase [Saccharopolyspora sp. HNM0983]
MSSLNADQRTRDLADLADRGVVDVLVVGGGITGAGVALDAASRGLRTALVEKRDLAFGTSRWSSKLVHGGLRYLASGDVGIAYESALERSILMRRTAPHLVRPLPQLVPLVSGVAARQAVLTGIGFLAGDLLRRSARTPSAVLPAPRRVPAAQVRRMVPAIRQDRLRGALLSWDGQLTDDARLVVGVARTAAAHGAQVLTRCAAEQVTGDGAVLRDERTGETTRIRARAVINAAGVWAGEVAPGLRLRPSRGTHLVVDDSAFGGLDAGLTVPVPGTTNRYVFALPAGYGRAYVGLTDEEQTGPVPDVPAATTEEVRFLLRTINSALARPIRDADVLATFSGLRPLLDGGDGDSADLSRSHAVRTDDAGIVSVVGGKLTTYRTMAEDAVDATGLPARPCRTRDLPLLGAASPRQLSTVDAPLPLVARYGTEAPAVVATAGGDERLLEPIEGLGITPAELHYAVRHEGALDVEDLLDRRTRIGLVAADRERARPAAERALHEAPTGR